MLPGWVNVEFYFQQHCAPETNLRTGCGLNELVVKYHQSLDGIGEIPWAHLRTDCGAWSVGLKVVGGAGPEGSGLISPESCHDVCQWEGVKTLKGRR